MHQAIPDTFGMTGQLVIRSFKDGKLVREVGPFKNKVVSSSGYGRNLIIRQLAGDTTYPIEIDTAAIGDGTTPPANGDTGLESSLLAGVPLTNVTVANNVLTIEVFIPDGDLADDTYSEFGFFANLRLMSRILISPSHVKASGEDTLFVYTLTSTG